MIIIVRNCGLRAITNVSEARASESFRQGAEAALANIVRRGLAQCRAEEAVKLVGTQWEDGYQAVLFEASIRSLKA